MTQSDALYRRRFLATAGATTFGVFAGCLGDDDGGGEGDNTDTEMNETETMGDTMDETETMDDSMDETETMGDTMTGTETMDDSMDETDTMDETETMGDG